MKSTRASENWYCELCKYFPMKLPFSPQSDDIATFIRNHLTPYDGDAWFLVGPSARTQAVWDVCKTYLSEERARGGIWDIDTEIVSTITSHAPGYIDRDNEVIVGLQTDLPLKRACKPLGGIRVVEKACEENNRTLNPAISTLFTQYRKTHNEAVYDVYTEQMRKLRKTGLLTGLPDSYARGRIIGDYRRVALFGVDALIDAKIQDKKMLEVSPMLEDTIRLREEVSEQIKALHELKILAASYGSDISAPATNAREAVQWIYFAYLAAVKEQDGAAMSMGNVNTVIDIFIEEDMRRGILTESEAQELIDQFVIKLRLVRHLRMHEYEELFSGDPTWVTESLGGVMHNGQHKVTKTSYRFLQTLYNLWPSPEPNLTVLWSRDLPEHFRLFCAQVSLDTSAIQYENDDVMRPESGCDDYGIACCVSQSKTGRQIQYFGARCNLAKALLLTINAGRDEITGIKLYDNIPSLTDDVLEYEAIWTAYQDILRRVARDYADTMNVIHSMHDKYYYERSEMALIDTILERTMAFGIAGLSVVVDSLASIRYGLVRVVRNAQGLSESFLIEGDIPHYGNDDDRADDIARDVVNFFMTCLREQSIYRDARLTLSVLTITSNVVYGKKTGATPDGRTAGVPFSPGANPFQGRETHGAIASLNSVAKIDFRMAQDGVSYTFSITPQTLWNTRDIQITNLEQLMNGYFTRGAHHLNVNVLNRETLIEAMQHPERYATLTIRVSGYAVHFTRLTPEQQKEVISRTFFVS